MSKVAFNTPLNLDGKARDNINGKTSNHDLTVSSPSTSDISYRGASSAPQGHSQPSQEQRIPCEGDTKKSKSASSGPPRSMFPSYWEKTSVGQGVWPKTSPSPPSPPSQPATGQNDKTLQNQNQQQHRGSNGSQPRSELPFQSRGSRKVIPLDQSRSTKRQYSKQRRSPLCVMMGSDFDTSYYTTNVSTDNGSNGWLGFAAQNQLDRPGLRRQDQRRKHEQKNHKNHCSAMSSSDAYEQSLQGCEESLQPSAPPPLSTDAECSSAASTYPRSPYESRPLWMVSSSSSALSWWWRTASTPSLSGRSKAAASSNVGRYGHRNGSYWSSDSVLHQPKVELKSILRRGGRFSSQHTGNHEPAEEVPAPVNQSHVVRFGSVVQVKHFEPAVERWAADGWSQWFC